MIWVDRLKREYSKGKSQLIAYRKTLDSKDLQQAEESKIVSGMISDMQYALEWMGVGKRPETRRGAERTDAYRHAELMDMDLLPALDLSIKPVELTEEQKRLIVQVLIKMSMRERQCYLLHMAQGLSYSEVSEALKISKATVQTHVRRAKVKVRQAI